MTLSSISEAATRDVQCEKVFLEISQNWQESTCARASVFEKHDLMSLCFLAKTDLCHIYFNVVNCLSFNIDSAVKVVFLNICRVAIFHKVLHEWVDFKLNKVAYLVISESKDRCCYKKCPHTPIFIFWYAKEIFLFQHCFQFKLIPF